jgi:hypothetical protein
LTAPSSGGPGKSQRLEIQCRINEIYLKPLKAAAASLGCVTQLTHGLVTKRQYLPMPYAPT